MAKQQSTANVSVESEMAAGIQRVSKQKRETRAQSVSVDKGMKAKEKWNERVLKRRKRRRVSEIEKGSVEWCKRYKTMSETH